MLRENKIYTSRNSLSEELLFEESEEDTRNMEGLVKMLSIKKIK
jgi:hypothetical protein